MLTIVYLPFVMLSVIKAFSKVTPFAIRKVRVSNAILVQPGRDILVSR
ncbi:hypothetical protein BS78_01G472200 [Paspalum vaginatum]|nr:hypothetical protein BS78_01G472200 [Paspalum vaginatum]